MSPGGRLVTARARAVLGAVTVLGSARLRPAHAREQLPVAPPHRQLFVVGCPRSGTTWVQDILLRHPSTIGTAESHAIVRSLNAVRRGAMGWAALLYGRDRDEILGRPVGLHRYVDRPTLRTLTSAAIARGGPSEDVAWRLASAIFDAYFLDSGGDSSSLFVEKTPLHIHHAAAILDRFPSSTVVEVVRDGRDVCISMENLPATAAFAPPPTRESKVLAWRRCIDAGRALRARPDAEQRVLTVRYEDLSADPTGQTARLFEFAGLEREDRLVAEVTRSTEFTAAVAAGAGLHLRSGTVGSWVDSFDDVDRAMFERVAGDAARQVGYHP